MTPQTCENCGRPLGAFESMLEVCQQCDTDEAYAAIDFMYDQWLDDPGNDLD